MFDNRSKISVKIFLWGKTLYLDTVGRRPVELSILFAQFFGFTFENQNSFDKKISLGIACINTFVFSSLFFLCFVTKRNRTLSFLFSVQQKKSTQKCTHTVSFVKKTFKHLQPLLLIKE